MQVKPEVRLVMKDEGAVLLHLGPGRYQSLNRMGALIWKEITAGATEGEVVARLCSRFPATPRERVESDVREFVAQLESRELVVPEIKR